MEELIEVLSTVYENYSNDIKEFERFFNHVLEKHKYPVQFQEKRDKVTQTNEQLQTDFNGSEERIGLGWKIDSSTQSEHEYDEELAEKWSETQSELKQAKEIIKSLESSSELENTTRRKMEEELEKTKSQIRKLSGKLNRVQTHLKQSKERIQFLEEESETEKLALAKTREALEKAKIQIKMKDESQSDAQLMETIKCLEDNHRLEKSAHRETSDDLEKAQIQVELQDHKNTQIQVQLTESKKMITRLENDFHKEKSAHEQTKELLEKAKHQNKEQDGKNMQMQFTIKQLREKMDRSEGDASADGHKKTKIHGRTMTEGRKQRASEQERSVENYVADTSKELKSVIEELQVQLQHTKTEKSSLRDSYEKEKAAHQSTKEELEQASYQIKVLTERCEGRRVKEAALAKLEDRVQQLQEKEDQLSEQVLQLQNSVESFREDLLACTSVITEPQLLQEAVSALKRRHLNGDVNVKVTDIFEEKYKLEISDLRAKIENCAALLDASLNTNIGLEEKLSSVDNVYAKRERNYVKLINTYVVKAHSLQTKLSTHMSKCKKPVQQRLRSWFNKAVLRKPKGASQDDEEEPPDLYPNDWRLPGIPDLRWKRKFSSKR